MPTADVTEQNQLAFSPATSFDIEVLDNLSAAETIWRALEREGTLSPYQRFDWLSHLLAAGADGQGQLAICVVRQDGLVRALLPLLIERKLGLGIARLLGARQANAGWMVLASGFSPDASAMAALITQIGERLSRVDLLELDNLPQSWNGIANPLLHLPVGPAPSRLYVTDLAGAQVPYIESRVPAKKRGNLRRGRRRMEESMGAVRLVRVDDLDLLDRVHAAFLEQRRARFSEMGVENVFGSPMFRAFFREAAISAFRSPRPVMVAHALMAGEEIVATTWGTTSATHYSLYINSTSSGPASKYSLMSIMIADLMDELITSGITSFDLGLGDFDYKADWTEPQTVFDALVPLTRRGAAARAVIMARTRLKRTIKQTPILWKAAQYLRRQLFRLRGGH
ncbi:GNAT family N-acetyltransferase [Devosia sp. XJ19-1]|uniref:GNAT family N-acetyltransferase n=1 Tax=Devosia ureilytica TaxID=2952754 RepID=A0A9Q4FS15_9HYPH|nr:GNAT family N-acetyltransferase [Devosia ureilytica]MCP8882810.1 GNAT family N-acetyltransferase [Devosia ureilytica]MCP8886822.1 GNAT family N-acetyltransferase [Devosia ureilytica]